MKCNWDRFNDIAADGSVFLLNLDRTNEHVSDLCKEVSSEQTPVYWRHFTRWSKRLERWRLKKLLKELGSLLADRRYRAGMELMKKVHQKTFVMQEMDRIEDLIAFGRYRINERSPTESELEGMAGPAGCLHLDDLHTDRRSDTHFPAGGLEATAVRIDSEGHDVVTCLVGDKQDVSVRVDREAPRRAAAR